MTTEELQFIKLGSLAKILWEKADKVKPAYIPENTFKAMKGIGAALVTGYFVDKMLSFIDDSFVLPMRKKKYFEDMLESNPDLLKEDPKEVADLWKTLWMSAPQMAQDPVASGAFVTQMIQKQVRRDYGGPTVDIYNTLATINKDLAQARSAGAGGTLVGDVAKSLGSLLGSPGNYLGE